MDWFSAVGTSDMVLETWGGVGGGGSGSLILLSNSSGVSTSIADVPQDINVGNVFDSGFLSLWSVELSEFPSTGGHTSETGPYVREDDDVGVRYSNSSSSIFGACKSSVKKDFQCTVRLRFDGGCSGNVDDDSVAGPTSLSSFESLVCKFTRCAVAVVAKP